MNGGIAKRELEHLLTLAKIGCYGCGIRASMFANARLGGGLSLSLMLDLINEHVRLQQELTPLRNASAIRDSHLKLRLLLLRQLGNKGDEGNHPRSSSQGDKA